MTALSIAPRGRCFWKVQVAWRMQTAEAKITKGYNLPARHVIHTVGPVWRGGKHDEQNQLMRCYLNSLKLAKEHRIKSIAFPLISSGAYGYPKEKAIKVAIKAFEKFLMDNDMDIILVLLQQ